MFDSISNEIKWKLLKRRMKLSADACYWLKCSLEMKIYGIV